MGTLGFVELNLQSKQPHGSSQPGNDAVGPRRLQLRLHGKPIANWIGSLKNENKNSKSKRETKKRQRKSPDYLHDSEGVGGVRVLGETEDGILVDSGDGLRAGRGGPPRDVVRKQRSLGGSG